MQHLDGLTKTRLHRCATDAIARTIDFDPGADVGKGAFIRLFLLTDQADGMKGMIELWNAWVGGNANAERRPIYEVLSFEKALRTALNYQERAHVSSWESRRPATHQYQGAELVEARVPELDANRPVLLIVSVSGLAALSDQRAGLYTVQLMEWNANTSIVRVISTTEDRDYLRMTGKTTVRDLLR